MRYPLCFLTALALLAGCATRPAAVGLPACCDGSARTPINAAGSVR